MLNAPKGQAEMQASHPVHVSLSINNVAILSPPIFYAMRKALNA
jgi:hypothetical protein